MTTTKLPQNLIELRDKLSRTIDVTGGLKGSRLCTEDIVRLAFDHCYAYMENEVKATRHDIDNRVAKVNVERDELKAEVNRLSSIVKCPACGEEMYHCPETFHSTTLCAETHDYRFKKEKELEAEIERLKTEVIATRHDDVQCPACGENWNNGDTIERLYQEIDRLKASPVSAGFDEMKAYDAGIGIIKNMLCAPVVYFLEGALWQHQQSALKSAQLKDELFKAESKIESLEDALKRSENWCQDLMRERKSLESKFDKLKGEE